VPVKLITSWTDVDITMREVQFQIAFIHRDGPRLFVGGRNCGDVLAVGDVVHGVGGDVRVIAILTYRRYLNVLEPGLTGELELSGDGVAAFEPGSDLAGRLQTEPPELELFGEGEFHVQPVS
jgi:hypothetical protein